MSDLIPFTYGEQEVRTVIRDGEIWWVATDVAKVLNMTSTSAASKIISNLEEDEKGIHQMDTPGGQQQVNIINESGLYRILMRSDKPEARPFQRWVTHDVLPSIRRTGKYDITQEGQETDWSTRTRFVTSADIHRENREAAELAVKFFAVLKDDLSSEMRHEVAAYLMRVPLGNTKAEAELEKQITGENVIIIRSYLKQRGLSMTVIKRYGGIFGVRVHDIYKREYGHSAPTKQKTMGGASRSGKLYIEKDRFIIDRAFAEFVKLGYFNPPIERTEDNK